MIYRSFLDVNHNKLHKEYYSKYFPVIYKKIFWTLDANHIILRADYGKVEVGKKRKKGKKRHWKNMPGSPSYSKKTGLHLSEKEKE